MGRTKGIPRTELDCVRHLVHRLSTSRLKVDIPFLPDRGVEDNAFYAVYPNGLRFKITVVMDGGPGPGGGRTA